MNFGQQSVHPSVVYANAPQVGQMAPPSPESPVSGELNKLAANISDLELQIQGLCGQLAPVMVPCAPDDPRGNSNASVSRGVVADTIAASNERLYSISQAIVTIRGRLSV